MYNTTTLRILRLLLLLLLTRIVVIRPDVTIGGRIDSGDSLAADIAVDCDVEVVTWSRRIEVSVEKERCELQLLRVGIDDVWVQTVLKSDEYGRRRFDQDQNEQKLHQPS